MNLFTLQPRMRQVSRVSSPDPRMLQRALAIANTVAAVCGAFVLVLACLKGDRYFGTLGLVIALVGLIILMLLYVDGRGNQTGPGLYPRLPGR